MMNYDNMTDEERARLNRAVGQCNFICLFLFCSAAFICGITATSFCAFVSRDVTTTQDVAAFCEELFNATESQCTSFLDNHGIGFWAWQATEPVDTTVCLSYSQYVDGKFIAKSIDNRKLVFVE